MILAYGLLGVLSIFAHHCGGHGCRDIQADTEHLHMAGSCMTHAGAKSAAASNQTKRSGSCCDRPHTDERGAAPLCFGNAGAHQLTRVIKIHWDTVDFEKLHTGLPWFGLRLPTDWEFHPDLVYEPLLTVRLII